MIHEDNTPDQELIRGLKEENKQLKLQLEDAWAANTAKEVFLSNMSHDIRTPMNAIIGMTALAKKHIDEKNRVQDALLKIETASAHLLTLINEVLDMSRINSGRMTLASELFSLSDLLHDTMVIMNPQIAAKDHRFELLTEDITAEELYGDELRLRQILVNILNNSVKYTENGGELSLMVRETMEGDLCHVTFVCKDNGIGMGEEFLQKIFEPFERDRTTTASKIEGTGLGMSIVKKMVEAMNGSIDIESEPGKGTVVSVSIPFRYEPEPAEPVSLSGKRLLILEADEKLIQSYENFLAGIPHTIHASMTEALEALTDADYKGEHYDAFLIGRTIADGRSVYDIASYLKRSYPDIVTILVSDANWEEIEYQAGRSGIAAFIPLPFFRRSLLDSLQDALTGGESSEVSAIPDLAGKNILLVEDNMINMEIAKEILSATGARIDTAENGKEALEKFKESPENWYQIILMDVQMPVMDGYEAVRQIRSLDRKDAADTPVFAMTANTFAEDIAKAREAGMNGHIAKPIDISALMQTLRQTVR